MHGLTITVLVAACLPLAAQIQNNERPTRRGPSGAGAAVEGADAIPRSLSDVDITQDAGRNWKCIHAGGRPCSEPEIQAVTTIIKSRSNVRNNLIAVAPDGGIKCTDKATGKPCPEADVQALKTGWDIKKMEGTGRAVTAAPGGTREPAGRK